MGEIGRRMDKCRGIGDGRGDVNERHEVEGTETVVADEDEDTADGYSPNRAPPSSSSTSSPSGGRTAALWPATAAAVPPATPGSLSTLTSPRLLRAATAGFPL